MRKIAVLLLAVMLIAAVTALPSFADVSRIKNGTPVVDGKLDGIWEDSVHFGIEEPNPECAIENAETYLLWDSEYMYFAAKVYDPDLNDSSGVTFFFSDNDGTGKNILQAITVDCYGEIVSAGSVGEEITYDPNMCFAAAQINEAEGYYVVELGVKLNIIGAGTSIGYHLLVTSDIDNEGEYVLCTNEGYTFLDHGMYQCIRTKAKAEAETTPGADTTTAPANTTAPAAEESGCGSVVLSGGFVTVLALACVPAVVIRKKK